ncbi:MAG: ABC transporter permease [Chloroflexota bacterium]|nr:MAG: ABC transporter permease [Chloroflexota bacterium]
MSPSLATTLRNIVAVARREFLWRGRTRTFKITTLLLVVVGVGLALAPVIIRFIDRGSTGDRIEVVVGDSNPAIDVPGALGLLLNAPIPGLPTDGDTETDYRVEAAADIEVARERVVDGSTSALLVLDRTAAGDLAFTLYSKDTFLSRTTQLVRQAASSIAIQDRLIQAGIPPIDQAALFAPPDFDVVAADPNATTNGPQTGEEFVGSFAISFVLSILLFMAIILYGQWVAFSVAEEKNSRVMEVVLAAATPFQLMAGKVAGVGGLALVQYIVVLVPSAAALIFQDRIASLILGGSSDVALPEGISISLLAVFGVMFVLGFALYAVLYAGAASLVSRQEDVNQIVAPLTIISVGGYLVASYAGTGLIPIDSPLVVILSFVPFFSPYLMLTRMGMGTAAPGEIAIAIALLALFIPVALWIAARLYRSGVLMYGQSPTPRTLWRALRAR